MPVLDLDRAALDFASRYGLRVLDGGRHPGVGTANRLVPLGSTYIELIAVVDASEAATSARSRRVEEAARAGRPFATWAARTDSLAAARDRLERDGWRLPQPQPGARIRPDGVRLEWTTLELAPASEDSVLPFLIEWSVPEGAHPGAAAPAHTSGAGDIVELHFTSRDPEAAARRLGTLGGEALHFEVGAGERDELVAIVLDGVAERVRIPAKPDQR